MIHTENLHDREIMEVLFWILFSACVQMKLNLKKKKLISQLLFSRIECFQWSND